VDSRRWTSSPERSYASDCGKESRTDFAPKLRSFPSYAATPDQALLGVPIREGCLWHLSAADSFVPVSMSLYVNGFAFVTQSNHESDGDFHIQEEASVSLSPFSVVRNCRFQTGECASWKSFKISQYADGVGTSPCCYFAVPSMSERDAEEERSDWVLGISHSIFLIIDSLLPPFAVNCDPVPGLSHTQRRLLAGYLVHRDDLDSVSVLFCELQAHSGSAARLVLYESELCQCPLVEVPIKESSLCVDVVGINCSSFIVDEHHFAAQTASERKLWLRAICNVKVKLQNQAPDPTLGELQHFRSAIRSQIHAISSNLERRIVSDALLPRSSSMRKALQAVGDGDQLPAEDGDFHEGVSGMTNPQVSL